ncbi:MAG: hypothetical protein ACJ759_06195 [Thermoanaerobaculia bacterium]
MEERSEHVRGFEDLRESGARAVKAGRLAEALAIFGQCIAWAELHGSAEQQDLAFCNRAAAAIELGLGDGELGRLREILMRRNCGTGYLAAYNIARHYELSKSYRKALFYARIARERAENLDRGDWLASSLNLMGNTLLAESLVADATRQYELALELTPPEPSVARGMVFDNLGYCRVLQGKHREGHSLLLQSLRMLRRLGPEAYQIPPRLDLCFLHIETGRYDQALYQGTRALALAERIGESDAAKNALYLLGEAENLRGNVPGARAYFGRLQNEFFPDASYLPGFLLAVDVRKLVNLHA